MRNVLNRTQADFLFQQKMVLENAALSRKNNQKGVFNIIFPVGKCELIEIDTHIGYSSSGCW